jgi:hypothetical protein
MSFRDGWDYFWAGFRIGGDGFRLALFVWSAGIGAVVGVLLNTR